MSYRPFADSWMLARPKVKYFGAYPAGFLLRARDLLGVGPMDQVLHVCSGRVRDYRCGPGCPGFDLNVMNGPPKAGHYHGLGPYDLTWDLDRSLNPDLIADVRDEKAWRSIIEAHPQIQAVLADPPYSRAYARNYAVGPDVLPSPGGIVKNAINILPIGGRVGILGLDWPRYPKAKARQIAITHVLVGNGNLGRTFAVYERTA